MAVKDGEAPRKCFLKPMMILAAFSSCCCYEFWLPFPAEAFAAAAAGPRMGKHHPKIAPGKCLT